jgi:hypothetical protein
MKSNFTTSIVLYGLLISLLPSTILAQIPYWESINQAYTSGGSGNTIREISSAPDGSMILTGRYNGDLEFSDGSAGFGNSKDGFLAKVNANGSLDWGRNQGGRANDTQCWSVDTDINGNVYVVGDFEYTAFIGGDEVTATGNSFDAFLVSYDPNGTKRWKKIFKGSNHVSAGKVRTNDGDLIVVSGYFDSSVDFGGGQTLTHSGPGHFLVAYDTTGSLQWKRVIDREEGLTDMRIKSDGSLLYLFPNYFGDTVIIDGITAYPENSANYVLVSTDDEGKASWVKQLGTSGQSTLRDLDIIQSGHFFVSGNVTDTVTYDGVDIKTSTGNKGVIYKFNSDGTYNKVLEIAEPVHSMSQFDNNIYFSSDFEGSLSIDGQTVNSSNGNNFLIAQLDDELSVNWIQTDGEGGGASFVRISASSEYVSAAGYFNATIEIGDTSVSTIGFQDFFTGNLRVTDFTRINEVIKTVEISFYPNPSSGLVNITSSTPINQITIHSSLGELVYQKNLNEQDISRFSTTLFLLDGLYFMSIQTNSGIETKKLILKRE